MMISPQRQTFRKIFYKISFRLWDTYCTWPMYFYLGKSFIKSAFSVFDLHILRDLSPLWKTIYQSFFNYILLKCLMLINSHSNEIFVSFLYNSCCFSFYFKYIPLKLSEILPLRRAIIWAIYNYTFIRTKIVYRPIYKQFHCFMVLHTWIHSYLFETFSGLCCKKMKYFILNLKLST